MSSEQRRERRTITLTTELDEYIAAQAERGHRPYSRQVELMLDTARQVLDTDPARTQIDIDALRDPSVANRVM